MQVHMRKRPVSTGTADPWNSDVLWKHLSHVQEKPLILVSTREMLFHQGIAHTNIFYLDQSGLQDIEK